MEWPEDEFYDLIISTRSAKTVYSWKISDNVYILFNIRKQNVSHEERQRGVKACGVLQKLPSDPPGVCFCATPRPISRCNRTAIKSRVSSWERDRWPQEAPLRNQKPRRNSAVFSSGLWWQPQSPDIHHHELLSDILEVMNSCYSHFLRAGLRFTSNGEEGGGESSRGFSLTACLVWLEEPMTPSSPSVFHGAYHRNVFVSMSVWYFCDIIHLNINAERAPCASLWVS